MSFAATMENPGSIARPISPYREFGAYEAMWTVKQASFRSIADRFREHPGSLPSDFVPEGAGHPRTRPDDRERRPGASLSGPAKRERVGAPDAN